MSNSSKQSYCRGRKLVQVTSSSIVFDSGTGGRYGSSGLASLSANSSSSLKKIADSRNATSGVGDMTYSRVRCDLPETGDGQTADSRRRNASSPRSTTTSAGPTFPSDGKYQTM